METRSRRRKAVSNSSSVSDSSSASDSNSTLTSTLKNAKKQKKMKKQTSTLFQIKAIEESSDSVPQKNLHLDWKYQDAPKAVYKSDLLFPISFNPEIGIERTWTSSFWQQQRALHFAQSSHKPDFIKFLCNPLCPSHIVQNWTTPDEFKQFQEDLKTFEAPKRKTKTVQTNNEEEISFASLLMEICIEWPEVDRELHSETVETAEILRNVCKERNRPTTQTARNHLIVGPPGIGKSEFIKELGKTVGIPVIVILASVIQSKFIRVGSKKLEYVFEIAKLLAPCALLFEEIDWLMKQTDVETHIAEIECSFLTYSSPSYGHYKNSGLFLFATSNMPLSNFKLSMTSRFNTHVWIYPTLRAFIQTVKRILSDCIGRDFDTIFSTPELQKHAHVRLRDVLKQILDKLKDVRRVLDLRKLLPAIVRVGKMYDKLEHKTYESFLDLLKIGICCVCKNDSILSDFENEQNDLQVIEKRVLKYMSKKDLSFSPSSSSSAAVVTAASAAVVTASSSSPASTSFTKRSNSKQVRHRKQKVSDSTTCSD